MEGRMDVDDDFGDLYSDVGSELGKNLTTEQSVDERDGDPYDENDEELLYGISFSSLEGLSSNQPSVPANTPRRSGIQLALAAVEADHDELLLYGQLYGVSTKENAVKPECPLRSVEAKAMTVSKADKSREDSRSLEITKESSFDIMVEDKTTGRGDVSGGSEEIPLGVFGMAIESVEKAAAKDGVTSLIRVLGESRNRGLPSESDSLRSQKGALVSDAGRPMYALAGVSNSVRVQKEFVIKEKEEEQELAEQWEQRANEGLTDRVEGDDEDWDSDSDDGIQIVLNDEASMYMDERPAEGGEDEGSEDEDDEDLVIVTGDDNSVPNEEQDWEEQPIPIDSLSGVVGATLSLGPDRAPVGEERGQFGRGIGGQGVTSGAPRIGYSGQGYHAHHMQFKYVRPGAGAASGMAPPPSQTSPQDGLPSSRGTNGGSLSGWGQGRGVAGRGDWAGGGGRGAAGQKLCQGYAGMASGGTWRGFSSGIEFNLPPTKTVFDVDLDSLEERPWRRPGVDITDYFNFSFTENSWKQYCRQLAQIRLEATMQSKIRVYESGRSEQEYDPDLPPELAAATGLQDASGDLNLLQSRPQDGGPGAGSGRGRGLGRGRVMLPAGRAIQVEGGGGERRPSADVRRQRSRDSDAVIQIVLQNASEDDHPACVPVNKGNEEFQEDERGSAGPGLEKEKRLYRSGPPAPWEMEGPPNMWEGENMAMGLGPMLNMMGPHGGAMRSAHRMDVDGPLPFPVAPGMPMHQRGPGPKFGMFPIVPFPPPPLGRSGMIGTPLYNASRPILPPQAPVLSSDNFPATMVSLEYHEPPQTPVNVPYTVLLPSSRRTPPHLTPPHRAPPQGLPVDWDDQLNNGSGANWNIREGRAHQELKDFDGGNCGWHGEETEGHESHYAVRCGRETDRSSLRERSMDEISAEGRSEELQRSMSGDHVENKDWDGYTIRIAKKQRVQLQGDTRERPGREGYNYPKIVKSNLRKEGPIHSWEHTKERLTQDMSQRRRGDAIHSKAIERKGPSPVEDTLNQRKDVSWNERPDDALKDRRQSRQREDVQRKVKDDDTRQHWSREELEWDRQRGDQERERRHPKKNKDENRILREDRSKGHTEDQVRILCESEEARSREEVKSASAEKEPEHSKEKCRHEEDRGKLKSRYLECRGVDGRLIESPDDLRDSDERGKGKLEERIENDGRLKKCLEDGREFDDKAKGRLEDIKDSDGRAKRWLEDLRESDGRVKGHREDSRESDGRVRVRLEDFRESSDRLKGRFEVARDTEGRTRERPEDIREMGGRAKGQLEDFREGDGRVKGRLDNIRENDGRSKGWLEALREGDDRVKPRFEDVRDNERVLKVRLEDLRDTEIIVKGSSEDLRESDGRGKGKPDDVREDDGRLKERLEDVRDNDGKLKWRLDDLRESDGRVKGRLDDHRESDARVKGRLHDFRESDARARGHVEGLRDFNGRGKSRLEEGREIDGRSKWYDKDKDIHQWDRRKCKEKSNRGDSTHGARQSVESRKVIEEQRHHKDKRAWEGSLPSKKTLGDRNGLLPGLGDDKSYRSHTVVSKKHRVEEYRTSAQVDKASARDSDDLAATCARQKEKKVVMQKRADVLYSSRLYGKDASSREHRVSKDENVSSLGNESSEEEVDCHGRSKLERWMSRKVRDPTMMGGENVQKWQASEGGHDEGPSTSKHVVSERKLLSRAEQLGKQEQKGKQESMKHSGKLHFETMVRSSIRGSSGEDGAVQPPTAALKDAAEKRKERLERLRLQAEVAARRHKNEASIPEAGFVEEVKQERPARKRRWGNG